MPIPGPSLFPSSSLLPGGDPIPVAPPAVSHRSFRQRDVSTPHFSIPFQLGGLNGGAFVNEQDSVDDVTDCIKSILAFPVGSREELPRFGSPDFMFNEITQNVSSQIANVVRQWEPRADTVISEERSAFDEYLRILRLQVRGRSDA